MLGMRVWSEDCMRRTWVQGVSLMGDTWKEFLWESLHVSPGSCVSMSKQKMFRYARQSYSRVSARN